MPTAPRTSPKRSSSRSCAGSGTRNGRSRSSPGSTRSPRTRASTSFGGPGAARNSRSTGKATATDGSEVRFPTAPGPDVAIESKQRLEDLQGAFRGVSDLHRRMLVLRELEGLSYSEIGDAPGYVPARRREHAVPRPAPSGRGVRGADQRPPLRSHPRRDRRVGGSQAPPPRGARDAPAVAAPVALPAVSPPRRARSRRRRLSASARRRRSGEGRRGSVEPAPWSSSSPPARSSAGRPARWCFGSPPAICRRGPWSVRSHWPADAGRRLRTRRSRHRDRIRSQWREPSAPRLERRRRVPDRAPEYGLPVGYWSSSGRGAAW